MGDSVLLAELARMHRGAELTQLDALPDRVRMAPGEGGRLADGVFGGLGHGRRRRPFARTHANRAEEAPSKPRAHPGAYLARSCVRPMLSTRASALLSWGGPPPQARPASAMLLKIALYP